MSRTILVVFLISIVAVGFARAQHHNGTAANSNAPVDLGKIEFPNSGPAEAQKHFIEGVLLLHSFEYGRARRSFQEASRIAPDFALAYWGEAMTYDHPIWGEHDNSSGLLALGRLSPKVDERRAKARTDREKMYLDAVEILFGDSDRQRAATNYSRAMFEITKRFPDDLEAQAFYSLSILGLTGTTRHSENYLRAAAVAEAVYEKNPTHPGALHYLIHSYDDPTNAHRGLRAAKAYGTVARSAAHAQHMPSHIFFALGLWEDSIAANTASMKTARDEGTGGYHPLFWLIHAYLQLGRVDEAAKLVTVIEEDFKTSSSPQARTHLSMARATFLVETRSGAVESMMQPVETWGATARGVFAGHDLAIGLEYVRRKDVTGAARMLDAIRTKSTAMKAAKTDVVSGSRYSTVTQSDVDTVLVMENMLDAAIQFASGEREKAIRNLIAAAEAEDKLVFEYGPPAIVKPAWEAAGEMLLAAGQKKQAADAFRKALKRYPNRRLSNEGLKVAVR